MHFRADVLPQMGLLQTKTYLGGYGSQLRPVGGPLGDQFEDHLEISGRLNTSWWLGSCVLRYSYSTTHVSFLGGFVRLLVKGPF